VLRLKTKQNPQMVWRDLRVQQMIIVSLADFFYRVTQSRRTQIMSLEAEGNNEAGPVVVWLG